MTVYPKPLPVPDVDSKPFWEGCHAHRLLLQRCLDCGTHRFPAGRFCAQCRSTNAEWVPASGKGSVFSWIVVRHPVPRDIYAAEVPYVVALIALAEGPRMPSNIVGCEPDKITADMPVEVIFEDVTPEITLPRFRPSASVR